MHGRKTRTGSETGDHFEIPAIEVGPRHDQSERGDRLAYLADMVRELAELADRDGCGTLAGLLRLAEVEAWTQSKRPSAG